MKELEKTYNPAAIEDRLYQKWLEEALYHRNASAQYHRPAPYGPRPGQHHAGHPDPL